jgi:hypothetical protein
MRIIETVQTYIVVAIVLIISLCLVPVLALKDQFDRMVYPTFGHRKGPWHDC